MTGHIRNAEGPCFLLELTGDNVRAFFTVRFEIVREVVVGAELAKRLGLKTVVTLLFPIGVECLPFDLLLLG
jgi:hypothetical protein